MITRLRALLAVLLALSGCAAPGSADTGYPQGTSVHTMSFGGLSRTYRVYKPAGLPAAAPLVVMLHGGFGSGEQAEKSYGWDPLADSAKFIVAYPDGIGRAWNVHGCCGQPAREGIDDVGFITAMVSQISNSIGVDPARVDATGISNGGMMSYTLACNSAVFAAIGPDSATQPDACSAPHPTSVMHIHGTADRLIPYNGGQGASVVDGPAVADVNAFWRNVDQCAAPAVSTGAAVTTSTAECAGNRSVVLITIDGGGHQWPGGTTFLERGDPMSQVLNATATFWEFFAAHPAS
ncbi:MAG TPA: PHB depolymerase family esterase [Mycobacterium sp.]|nr:PHB depolymerase family esterase [Mycobacterium sp.]